MKVFDWNKAAKLIVRHNVQNAYAFIDGMQNTKIQIFKEGKLFVDTSNITDLKHEILNPTLEYGNTQIYCYTTNYNKHVDWAYMQWPLSAIHIVKQL